MCSGFGKSKAKVFSNPGGKRDLISQVASVEFAKKEKKKKKVGMINRGLEIRISLFFFVFFIFLFFYFFFFGCTGSVLLCVGFL